MNFGPGKFEERLSLLRIQDGDRVKLMSRRRKSEKRERKRVTFIVGIKYRMARKTGETHQNFKVNLKILVDKNQNVRGP
jgi:hypothetical protein